jgi:hypothetical protein
MFALCLALALAQTSGPVDVALSPQVQCVPAGSVADVRLVLSSNTPVSIGAVDLLLSWNPAQLQYVQSFVTSPGWLVGSFLPDPDGINLTLTDGNGLFTLLASPFSPPALPPAVNAVTFRFKVLQSGSLSVLPNLGAFGKTQVLGVTPGSVLTGNLPAPVLLGAASGPGNQVQRLGTPPNPAALLPAPAGGPLVGQPWNPRIDHTTFFPGALLDLLAVTPLPSPVDLPTAFGTILCDISSPILFFDSPAGLPFAIPIPLNCNLVGKTICTQGVSTDGLDVQLTNALDITFGTF